MITLSNLGMDKFYSVKVKLLLLFIYFIQFYMCVDIHTLKSGPSSIDVQELYKAA